MLISLLELQTKREQLKRQLDKEDRSDVIGQLVSDLVKLDEQIEAWGKKSNTVYRIM